MLLLWHRNIMSLNLVEILYHHFLHLDLVLVLSDIDVLIAHSFISWLWIANALWDDKLEVISYLSS